MTMVTRVTASDSSIPMKTEARVAKAAAVSRVLAPARAAVKAVVQIVLKISLYLMCPPGVARADPMN